MANSENQKQPHALLFSLHLQGHIIPSVNLAIKLASKGITVTFVHLEFIHHQISSSQNLTGEIDLFSQARNSGLDINYATISDGFPAEFDRSENNDQFLNSFYYDFPRKADEFVGGIISSDSSSRYGYFIVADTFSFWAPGVAEKHGIACISLWTEPALVFSLYCNLELLRKNGHVPVNGQRVEIDYIPGIQSINTKDFMSYLHDSDITLLHTIISDCFQAVKMADFVLCNTVEELEEEAISGLREFQTFYSIGPLFSSELADISVPRSLLPESDCREWLNDKAAGSVLYVSFGSLAVIEERVIHEIAGGLLIGEVSFVWVLRPGMVSSNEGDVLPEGFRQRTKHRGLIVPWCKQDEVLSNPAIGGFLTHCGWNSVLESIWFGIPMLCYPLFTDQITNRKLVVDDWKAGLNLCDGESITGEEVGNKIEYLMNDERSSEQRQQIKTLRRILTNALSKDGSSLRNFDHFVEILKESYKIR